VAYRSDQVLGFVGGFGVVVVCCLCVLGGKRGVQKRLGGKFNIPRRPRSSGDLKKNRAPCDGQDNRFDGRGRVDYLFAKNKEER